MLRETSQEKALRLAAVRPLEECEEIQARIRKAHLRSGHDPDGRPPRLERLVAHIGKHLFEGTLSVEGACKAVGIGDRAIGGSRLPKKVVPGIQYPGYKAAVGSM